uniref:Arrestin-C n=1 Tax=Chelydra serpentina TaxID=8475 RepID=A0A8C3RQK8_CHESE
MVSSLVSIFAPPLALSSFPFLPFAHLLFSLSISNCPALAPVYVILTCAFRYGRDDLDVIGLTFRKDLYVLTTQIYPPAPEQTPTSLTPLQEKLLKKLGEHAYPFTFEMATNLPCSVTLQPGPDDLGKACGVDFEVKGFCAENLEEKIHKRNSVRLVIRKVQFAPVNTGPAPKSETTRQFMMSDKPLHLEASLDKEIYYHGDPITVNININNTTTKIVKKIKISGERESMVFPLCIPFSETVAANSTFSKSYTVTPSLSSNREKRGLALDGKLKHEDTNLASTTVLRPGMDKEVLGILVSYKVKVNLVSPPPPHLFLPHVFLPNSTPSPECALSPRLPPPPQLILPATKQLIVVGGRRCERGEGVDQKGQWTGGAAGEREELAAHGC